MKTALLGGTFNPVHFGHLFLADEVLHKAGYDHIIFVPTFMPAHKKMKSPVKPADRLEMLNIAVKPYDCFSVDDCEIKRKGISFMIDTLREVHRKYGFPGKIGLIIGDDLADSFHTWKNPQDILELAELVVVKRLHVKSKNYGFPCTVIENKIVSISSTEIRERIQNSEPVRFLLPEGVCSYIEEKKLYRSA
ncbi:MAG: nicotinate (nicotinamide) nucleotide adenylyltransferase [Spirochaetales bacterium]|nr:nicotinate (nicotinamide) nucleotide adenylyltransferase [Spirochaetales bacterium]